MRLLSVAFLFAFCGCASIPTNPDARPAGKGWFCSRTPGGRVTDDPCAREQSQCLSTRSASFYECVATPEAWCFTVGRSAFCYPESGTCKRKREVQEARAELGKTLRQPIGQVSDCEKWD